MAEAAASGIASVQIARAMGITVLATAGTERGRALVVEQGAHRVFDHPLAGLPCRHQRGNVGRGVDVIIEMLANVNLDKDLSLLARAGRVVVVGNRGRVEIDAGRRWVGMRRSWNDADERDARRRLRIHAALDAGLANGTLRPVVGREFRWRGAAAHDAVMEAGAHGKIVLIT